jgi:hypothetical protein
VSVLESSAGVYEFFSSHAIRPDTAPPREIAYKEYELNERTRRDALQRVTLKEGKQLKYDCAVNSGVESLVLSLMKAISPKR